MSEKRETTRRRVLLGGRVTDRVGVLSMECQLLNMSETGARVEGPSLHMLPKEIYLIINPRGERRMGVFVWRDGKQGGIQFESDVLPPSDRKDRMIRRLKAEKALLMSKIDGSEV